MKGAERNKPRAPEEEDGRGRRRDMDLQEPEGVTFHDASAYFSQEEWRLLHDWQKELYSNVMKEIHQALISLSPLIVNTVFSLRTKEKQELCSVDKQVLERRHEEEPGSVYVTHLGLEVGESSTDAHSGNQITPFPIKGEEETCTFWNERRAGKTCPLGCPGYFLPDCADHSGESLAKLSHQSWKKDFGLRKEEEPFSDFIDHSGEEDKESSSDLTSGNKLLSSPIKGEGKPYSIRYQDARRDEICSIVHQDTARDEIYCIEHEDCERGESLYNSLSEGHWSKINRIEGSEITGEAAPFISLLEKAGARTGHQINNQNQVWSERNLEQGSQGTDLRKSGSSKSADSSLQFETLVLPSSSRNHRNKSHLSTTNYSGQSSAPKGRGPYISPTSAKVHEPKNFSTHLQTHAEVFRFHCIYCEKQFNHKGHFYTHMRTHTKETPFTCTECGKSFSQKGNLKTHLRTHSEERPFQCSDCGKGFKLKGNLVEHQAAHSGHSIARPYQCTDCGKTFNRNGKYEAHRRIHT